MEKRFKEIHWRARLHRIIYGTDTYAGKLFDVILLTVIIASILIVMLESVESLQNRFGSLFNILEWIITILFTLEYIARILTVKKPIHYIFSFYGVIDFLSTIPKYISLIYAGSQGLVALRALRLLRIFRVFKLARYLGASDLLMKSLLASRAKISVFVFAVLIISVIFGTVMYMVESDESGFTSIPSSVYWCIVTLTTVGYGDISPATPLGQLIASFIMILGYGIIAVPTGIVTAEFANQSNKSKNPTNTQKKNNEVPADSCINCGSVGHHIDSKFCYKCGNLLNE